MGLLISVNLDCAQDCSSSLQCNIAESGVAWHHMWPRRHFFILLRNFHWLVEAQNLINQAGKNQITEMYAERNYTWPWFISLQAGDERHGSNTCFRRSRGLRQQRPALENKRKVWRCLIVQQTYSRKGCKVLLRLDLQTHSYFGTRVSQGHCMHCYSWQVRDWTLRGKTLLQDLRPWNHCLSIAMIQRHPGRSISLLCQSALATQELHFDVSLNKGRQIWNQKLHVHMRKITVLACTVGAASRGAVVPATKSCLEGRKHCTFCPVSCWWRWWLLSLRWGRRWVDWFTEDVSDWSDLISI